MELLWLSGQSIRLGIRESGVQILAPLSKIPRLSALSFNETKLQIVL